MQDYRLAGSELVALRIAHKGTKDKRKADKIKAVYLLGSGWKLKDIHEALLLDEDTLRHYYARYADGNLMGLIEDKYINNKDLLSCQEQQLLDTHLQEVTYRTAKEVLEFVKHEYDVEYSLSGIQALLKRLGYVYKKPQKRPAKANVAEQAQFKRWYSKLRKSVGIKDKIYFIDTTHPRHETLVAHGWMKRGQCREIHTTAKQPTLTISGALDIADKKVIPNIFRGSMNTETALDLLEKLRQYQPGGYIHLICDRARYFDNQRFRAYAESMAIKIRYLPAYSPNLNLIERVWLYFKKVTLYNRCFLTYADFEVACRRFFTNQTRHKLAFDSLLVEKFQTFSI